MRIAVHAKVLSEEQLNGIGVYTYNVLKALSRIDTKNDYTLYSNQPIVHRLQAENFNENIVSFPALWSYLRFPFEFISNKYDLLFVPKEMVPPIKRPKTIVVCFDLMGLLFADRISMKGKVHFWVATHYALHVADKIIAISESTKTDIIEKCGVDPDKIMVTPLGYDEELYQPRQDKNSIQKIKAKYGVTANYILNTSSLLWYRKNIPRLIKAFHACKSRMHIDLQLVITGKKGEAYGEVVNLLHALGLEKDVILTGYVPSQEMPFLLNGAEALVFPSLHEGFGLPLVEAMACGCPVITSNCSAMPEVVGDAAILIDPYNEEEIEAAMTKVVGDAELRIRMKGKSLARARQFSWERTARKTLKVFESLRG